MLSSLLTYFLNPGTIYKSSKKGNKVYCRECDFSYPYHKKLKHCYTCNVCIIGIDHHCGVFGKCIARNNIVCFYGFIVLTFVSIFSSMGILVYTLSQLPF
jgi:hypothetical protein